jgi:methionyl-tRNA synthetase
MITIDDFKKIELKTGKIISVENHSNADKLYVLKVDIGGEIRQIVAGLKPYLKPEELLNRNVAVVVNLQPAMLRGVESQGMVLAASAEGLVTILTPDKEVPPGSRVS